jgi:hypothetical protein
MAKTVDIFYKSYAKDYWLLYLSLKTITKNVTGYNNVVLLIPEQDKEIFDTSDLPPRTLVHYVKDEGAGWLRQQYFKMTAYKYCFAEFILFSDSDCLWDHPIDLQDYIADGKPEILYTSWDKVGQAICWRYPTEKFMKGPVEWEMMRRNNQIHYRQTLLDIAEYAPDLEQQIMNSDGFSEFNAMAAYAHKYCRDRYTFKNTDDWTYVPPLAIQVWSHSSKKEGMSDTHLREYIRLLESIMKSFGVPVP